MAAKSLICLLWLTNTFFKLHTWGASLTPGRSSFSQERKLGLKVTISKEIRSKTEIFPSLRSIRFTCRLTFMQWGHGVSLIQYTWPVIHLTDTDHTLFNIMHSIGFYCQYCVLKAMRSNLHIKHCFCLSSNMQFQSRCLKFLQKKKKKWKKWLVIKCATITTLRVLRD